jgi:RNA polymerase sigma factor (sigma-70 family)
MMESNQTQQGREGESVGIGELRGQLIFYAMRYVNHSETAEDLVQEAFLRLSRSDAIEFPKSWLYTTVRNLSLNYLRDRKQTVAFEEKMHTEDGAWGETPSAALEHLQRVEDLRGWMDRLPDRQQRLLRLKFEEGLSYRQISQRTGLSVTNVGYILCQAIRSLQGYARGGKVG